MVVGTIIGLAGTATIAWFTNRSRTERQASGLGTNFVSLILTLSIIIGLILLVYLGLNIYLNLADLTFRDILGDSGNRLLDALNGEPTKNNPQGNSGVFGLVSEYLNVESLGRTVASGTALGGFLTGWSSKRTTQKGFVNL